MIMNFNRSDVYGLSENVAKEFLIERNYIPLVIKRDTVGYYHIKDESLFYVKLCIENNKVVKVIY